MGEEKKTQAKSSQGLNRCGPETDVIVAVDSLCILLTIIIIVMTFTYFPKDCLQSGIWMAENLFVCNYVI